MFPVPVWYVGVRVARAAGASPGCGAGVRGEKPASAWGAAPLSR